jgi:hypothetical protein
MLVLDVLFDHIQRISSNVEIIQGLVQFVQFRQLKSEWSIASVWSRTDDFRSTPKNRHRHRLSACLKSAKGGSDADADDVAQSEADHFMKCPAARLDSTCAIWVRCSNTGTTRQFANRCNDVVSVANQSA